MYLDSNNAAQNDSETLQKDCLGAKYFPRIRSAINTCCWEKLLNFVYFTDQM